MNKRVTLINFGRCETDMNHYHKPILDQTDNEPNTYRDDRYADMSSRLQSNQSSVKFDPTIIRTVEDMSGGLETLFCL